MKKLFLTGLTLCIGFALISQDLQKDEFINLPSKKAVANHFEFTKTFSPVVNQKNVMDEDIVIGETRYDMQTSGSVANRIYSFEDGTVGTTWTMGFEDGAGFPDRGTGYNYFDGTDWGPIPTQRIETVRTGWPSYAPYGPNGEIVIAHSSDHTIIINKRENKGEGDWEEMEFFGPEGGPGLLWPRVMTSGENHDTIHIIALTTPVANGGSIYEDMDGALLYSRSTDGGQSWNPENVILPGLGSDDYAFHTADSYAWAWPNAGKIAFVVFDGRLDGVVMKSDDGGDSWDKTRFFEFPWGGGPIPDDTERYGGGDASNAIAIDNEGMVHVAFGRMCHKNEGGTGSWYPWSNGLLYWNEDMEPLDTALVGATSVYYVPPILYEEGYLISKVGAPFDSLAGDVAKYYEASLTSFPQLIVDMHDFYATYSAVTYGYVNGDYNYRHIYEIQRWTGNEPFWDTLTIVDRTADLFHLFSECVFASACPSDGGYYYHLIYQTDNLPGVAVAWEQHEITDNNIVYLPKPVIPGYDEHQFKLLSYVSQNYPNPASEYTYVKVKTSKQTELKLIVTDLLGKTIAEYNKGEAVPGVNYFTIDVAQLPEGIYLYTVLAGANKETRKMIVE